MYTFLLGYRAPIDITAWHLQNNTYIVIETKL